MSQVRVAAASSVTEFLIKYAAEVPEDVRQRAVVKLQEAGVHHDWQVMVIDAS